MKKTKSISALFISVLLTVLGLSGCMQDSGGLKGLSDAALNTINSLKEVDKSGLYSIDYAEDYKLDKLMEQGTEDIYALDSFISDELLGGLPFRNEMIEVACSDFTAVTPEGDYIQGRNMDLPLSNDFIVHTKPENGYESLSMVTGLLLGYSDVLPDSQLGRLYLMAAPYYPCDGINETGLSVAMLALYDTPAYQDTGKKPITTTLALRLILDKAATVNEAIELLEQYDMRSIGGINLHFQVADAAGDSAVIEYANEEMQIFRSEENGQAVTNFFLSPDMAHAYRDGEDRFEKLEKSLKENKGIISTEKAWQMLNDVKVLHEFDEETGIDYSTDYSIIYNNTKRTMDICNDMNFDKVYSYKVGGDF